MNKINKKEDCTEYKGQIIDMLKEWKKYNDTYDVNRSPEVIFKNDYDDFDYYLDNLEAKEPKDVTGSSFHILLFG